MEILSENDYHLFERLVSLTERELYQAMKFYLQKKYNNVFVHENYLIASGDIPVALVSHMDTVFQFPVQDLYYDKDKGVIWSPQGLGSDDRAGIFAIIKIIQAGLRPSIILTTGEEIGGVGAGAICEDFPVCPIDNLKYLIELDRRGKDDCVFYDCFCPSFCDYVESFGFKQQIGTFSDISFLMPVWDIVGVNLSIGYENEHSYTEILFVEHMLNTIKKVIKMLKEESIPEFKYDEIVGLNFYQKTCYKCKKDGFFEYEVFPVKADNGFVRYYCPDCMVNNIEWCTICREPFEKDGNETICKRCKEGLCKVSKKSKNNSNE